MRAEFIILKFRFLVKVRLQQKCRIWQNYDYYVMVTLVR